MGRNVLIFHAGALGDYLLTWPLLMAASRMYAQSRIISVTHASKGALARKALRIDSDDIEQGWHGLFSTSPSVSTEAPPAASLQRGRVTPESRLREAHLVVTFLGSRDDAAKSAIDAIDSSPRSAAGAAAWNTNVRAIAPESTIVNLQARPSADYAGHVTQFWLDRLAGHRVLAEGMKQMLASITARGIGGHKGGGGGGVLIHPGSGGERKNWPIERFIRVAEKLRESGRRVRLVVGEVEREKWPAAALANLSAVDEIVQPVDAIALFDLLATAESYLGNDTGPTHLAAMIGVPTVALFGKASNAEQWRPIGPRVVIITRETLAAIEVEEVLKAI